MQTAALAELGLADEWSYEAIEVAPEDFDERVRAMPGEGFVGANVTVPHKLAALAIANRASEAARAIGAANTLTFARRADRRREHRRDRVPRRAARVPGRQPRARARRGGLGAGRRVGAGRTPAPRSRSGTAPREGRADWPRELGASAAETASASADFDLLVNATTVGMGSVRPRRLTDLKSLPIDADSFGETHQLVDLAYGSVDTELVRAQERGGPRSSTGSRCWFARGPRRFGSGPGWSPRSRR